MMLCFIPLCISLPLVFSSLVDVDKKSSSMSSSMSLPTPPPFLQPQQDKTNDSAKNNGKRAFQCSGVGRDDDDDATTKPWCDVDPGTTDSPPLLPTTLPSSSSPSISPNNKSSTNSNSDFVMIDDDLVKCRMEDLEQANDAQLYEILQELKQTPFFRTFVVDLHQNTCPLYTSTTTATATAATAAFTSNDQHQRPPIGSIPKDNPTTTATTTTPECSGGDVGADLDDDAEPLCTVDPGTEHNNNNNKLLVWGGDSNALTHLQSAGFESQSQKEAFSWKDATNAIITEVAEPSTATTPDRIAAVAPNGGDDLYFWKDMCSSIGQGDGSTTVNLALNPERNTGYNGTHIWRAIYEENCSLDDNNDYDSSSTTSTNHMCLEERVLYRLLSGLHTSTTVAIAHNYHPPSKKKGRATWTPNASYFMKQFAAHPEYIRNLHFSYVVLLRALGKASPFLYRYADSMMTDDDESDNDDREDAVTTAKLLRRLLDSSILKSCNVVFAAFDESLMFQEDVSTITTTATTTTATDVLSIRRNFKGVFHNVSSILDCVQCQQCKLHGKLAMLGYGAALKVLFMPPPPVLDRNEIVALINTIVKLSESVKHVRELSTLYYKELQQEESQQQQDVTLSTIPVPQSEAVTTTPPTAHVAPAGIRSLTSTEFSTPLSPSATSSSFNLIDSAIGVIAELGRSNRISFERERELVVLALAHQTDLLILAKHYGTDMDKFLSLSSNVGSLGTTQAESNAENGLLPDVIIVGSGLAGMATALNVLDRGGRIVMIEKEHLLGGNSNKASSGINACCDGNSSDSLQAFKNDTMRSAGDSANEPLISTLVTKSAEAVEWLKTRVGVDLSLKAQLGGHSSKRTHRPNNGMAGAEIIYGIQKAVKAYIKSGKATILTNTKVKNLLTREDGRVIGVECVAVNNNNTAPFEIKASNVVLATGGFAADRSEGSYLDKHRPELLKMPTTAGAFSTGDGITLATHLGAATVSMDKVQLHPTGWVDPSDPDNPSKVLAAELMRGVGGILLNDKGKRFCNELGTRSYVTKMMLQHDPCFAETGKWCKDSIVPSFSLILSSSAAQNSKKHVDLYMHKGILARYEGVESLAEWMGQPKSVVVSTMKEYQKAASSSATDKFGKTTFDGVPSPNLDTEVFYAGKVTPVLHYCMGGISIDPEGNVLDSDGKTIPGLHAVGEVSGGVHGVNRLGGNSLLECTVFGTIVGKKLPIQLTTPPNVQPASSSGHALEKPQKTFRNISKQELEQHNMPQDCWVAIHGTVYDFTEFADDHPAGPQSIHDLAGKDGTDAFTAVHNKGMLDDFNDEVMGVYSG